MISGPGLVPRWVPSLSAVEGEGTRCCNSSPFLLLARNKVISFSYSKFEIVCSFDYQYLFVFCHWKRCLGLFCRFDFTVNAIAHSVGSGSVLF